MLQGKMPEGVHGGFGGKKAQPAAVCRRLSLFYALLLLPEKRRTIIVQNAYIIVMPVK